MIEEVKKSRKFWIEDELIDKHLDKISGNELKVLLKITRHYNKQGTCFPSIRKMKKPLNLNSETISKCLKKLELLGFLEQLVIKERYKLRYSFSKSARFFLIESNKLPEKPSSKEVIKEVLKEEKKYTKEQLKKDFPKEYEKIYGNEGKSREKYE